MQMIIFLNLTVLGFFATMFYLLLKRNEMFRRSEVKSIARAAGDTIAFGTIGADSAVVSPFSGKSCVYYCFTVDFRFEEKADEPFSDRVGDERTIEKWIEIIRRTDYVPFYIFDSSGARLSVTPPYADYDLYPAFQKTVQSIESDPGLDRAVRPLIPADKQYLLGIPVKIREELLLPGGEISVASRVETMDTAALIENIGFEARMDEEMGGESGLFRHRWIHYDASIPVTRYTARMNGRNISISDDKPGVVLKAFRRKRALYLAGIVLSALSLSYLVFYYWHI